MMMFRNWTKWALGLAAASICWATAPAHPGTLNYIEGQAAIDGQTVTAQSAGNASVNAGSVLSTGSGHAEMLLTPGVFLRLGQNSSVRMVQPGLTDTRVEVLQGVAMVEANNLRDENHVRLLEDHATVDLRKNGLYKVDGDRSLIAVYDGKANVTVDDRQVELKGGRELDLNGQLKARKFDKKEAQKSDDLYQWSKLRSDYVNGASATLVTSGWSGPGWGWSPVWGSWGFAPAGGMLYSPFGLGFFSPWDYGYGGYGGYWGGGFGGYYRPPVVIVPGGGRGGIGRGHVPAIHGSGPAISRPAPATRSFGGGAARMGGGGGGGMRGGRGR